MGRCPNFFIWRHRRSTCFHEDDNGYKEIEKVSSAFVVAVNEVVSLLKYVIVPFLFGSVLMVKNR